MARTGELSFSDDSETVKLKDFCFRINEYFPKIDDLNGCKIGEVRKSINRLFNENLAKILWDFTYLCWNMSNTSRRRLHSHFFCLYLNDCFGHAFGVIVNPF